MHGTGPTFFPFSWTASAKPAQRYHMQIYLSTRRIFRSLNPLRRRILTKKALFSARESLSNRMQPEKEIALEDVYISPVNVPQGEMTDAQKAAKGSGQGLVGSEECLKDGNEKENLDLLATRSAASERLKLRRQMTRIITCSLLVKFSRNLESRLTR